MIEIDLDLALEPFTLQVNVSFASQATVLFGPSGAGKTSLLETIAGLRPTVRGRISLQGTVLFDSSRRVFLPPEQRRIGYVPQEAALFPHLSVLENLQFGVSNGSSPLRVLPELIDLLDLGSLLERAPATLSGGECMRVALGRALATSPRLLLLDEPLRGLDVERKQRIVPYLLRLREAGRCPFLYVTHNHREAILLGHEVVLLTSGKIAAQGKPADLLSTKQYSFDL